MIDFWSYLVIIFGYIAPPVFIVGIAWRIWNYKRYPTGLVGVSSLKPLNRKLSICFGGLWSGQRY